MRILLIGGWGMPAAVLEPLRMALGIGREHCLLLDRPLAQWRQQAQAAITPGSVLVGWSLGGSLALELAGEVRDRVTAVVTIGSNPHFLATPDWPHGYDATQFDLFAQELARDPAATLARFTALATLGSQHQREEARWMRAQLEPETRFSAAVLEETLSALRLLDNRERLANLDLPVLHLLGQADTLVPAALAADLRALNPGHQVRIIEGMAHLPSFRYASETAEAVREFVLPMLRSWC